MSANVFHYKRRVEFCETDAAGIVHFSALLQYAEQAEHALLRKLGSSVLVVIHADGEPARTISWPRVKIATEFHGSAKFEDELDIAIYVSRLGNKSVTYAYRITRSSEPICSGSSTCVCCEIDATGRIASVEIPLRLKESLRAYAVPS